MAMRRYCLLRMLDSLFNENLNCQVAALKTTETVGVGTCDADGMCTVGLDDEGGFSNGILDSASAPKLEAAPLSTAQDNKRSKEELLAYKKGGGVLGTEDRVTTAILAGCGIARFVGGTVRAGLTLMVDHVRVRVAQRRVTLGLSIGTVISGLSGGAGLAIGTQTIGDMLVLTADECVALGIVTGCIIATV